MSNCILPFQRSSLTTNWIIAFQNGMLTISACNLLIYLSIGTGCNNASDKSDLHLLIVPDATSEGCVVRITPSNDYITLEAAEERVIKGTNARVFVHDAMKMDDDAVSRFISRLRKRVEGRGDSFVYELMTGDRAR